jgi:hypothetical protein
MYTKEQMEAKDAFYQEVIANLHETMRDRFAMAALPALMADYAEKGYSGHDLGATAYSIADNLMQARDIRRDSGQSD